MQSGNLRTTITIQEATETISASGAVISSWSDAFTRSADVQPLQGREYWSGAQLLTERIVVFVIRYSREAAAIGPPRHRVSLDGRTYDIESVIDVDNRHRELNIRCKQRD